MKLILGSDLSFLLKYGYSLTGIPKDEMNIGYITTATKAVRTHQQFFADIKTKLKSEGYKFEEIDIESKSKENLLEFFKDKNIIQIEGGNTFYLIKAIRETGFAEILNDLLKQGKIYIGTSAGSYIMCPSITMAQLNSTNMPWSDVADLTALNYVPFVLKAHYKDESKDIVKAKQETLSYPLRILRDGEGILVEDSKYTFIGDNKETII